MMISLPRNTWSARKDNVLTPDRIRFYNNGAAVFFVADKTYDERVAAGPDIGDGKLSVEVCRGSALDAFYIDVGTRQ